jgi:dTMP kinase
LAFQQRVRAAFLALAATDPDHYLVADAGLAPDQIATAVRDRLRPALGRAAAHARVDL